MTEQELTRAILDELAMRGVAYCWRNNTGMAKAHGHRVSFGKVGSGDILGMLSNGRHLELEVKLPGGKYTTTREQREHGARVLAMGGLWAVVRSVDEALTVVGDALAPKHCAQCNTTGDRNWNRPEACAADPCDCAFSVRYRR